MSLHVKGFSPYRQTSFQSPSYEYVIFCRDTGPVVVYPYLRVASVPSFDMKDPKDSSGDRPGWSLFVLWI